MSEGPPGYVPLPLIRVEEKELQEVIIGRASVDFNATYGILGAFVER
jgi:hypothetical protein